MRLDKTVFQKEKGEGVAVRGVVASVDCQRWLLISKSVCGQP